MVAEQCQLVHRINMTFGNSSNDATLRKATLQDLDAIKQLMDEHRNELGFVIRAALERSIISSEIIVAIGDNEELLGFVHYHHRRDGQTTIYNIVVRQVQRRQGIGRKLLDELKLEASNLQQQFMFLKCPEQLPANKFYRDYGFLLTETQKGKKRELSIWQIDI